MDQLFDNLIASGIHSMWNINQFIKRDQRWKCYKFLKRSQYFTLENIEKLQFERLKRLLLYAYQNVPYYRKIFNKLKLKPGDIKTLSDLSKLPILTKETIRKNFKDLITTDKNVNKIPYQTGGSTGKPLEFFVTKECKDWGHAAQWRAFDWWDIKKGDKIAKFGGLSPRFRTNKTSNKLKDKLLSNTIFLNAYNFSEGEISVFINEWKKLKPKVVYTNSASAEIFARYLKSRNINNIQADIMVTQGEKLLDSQRKLFKETFKCNIYDFYGAREISGIAAECKEHTGYHISSENIVLEFIKNDSICAPGELGNIIITDLHNYVFPLIRYGIEDLGIPSEESCSCGVNLPLMRSIEGRSNDMIILDNGQYLSPTNITTMLYCFPIDQYQIIQRSKNKIEMRVVKGKEYTEETEELIKLYFIRMVHDDWTIDHISDDESIDIEIIYVDDIPVTDSGKFRYIISEVPIDF